MNGSATVLKTMAAVGGIFLNGNLNGVAVYVYADFRALIRRARGEPAKAVHKLLHAAHKHSVAAEYGRNGAAFNTLGNTDNNLFRREFFAGEIFLEQLVARFGDGLVNGGTQTLKTGAMFGISTCTGLPPE